MRLMETHAHWGSMEKLAVNQTIAVHTQLLLVCRGSRFE